MSDRPYEKYEYLFIDMEWNQKAGTSDVENREPIQIGIIGADEKLECQKSFSKSICLDDVETLTEDTCKRVYVNRKSVMQARPEKEVLDRVKQSFPVYKYVVVWEMSTYDLFLAGMQRAGIRMPKHKVLVLQDILNVIAVNREECLEFETALVKAGISYEPQYLHYAKHDVRYLFALFKGMYFRYTVLTDGESSVVNPKTKTIHNPDCRYVKNKNHETVTNAKCLLFCGYKPCMCCGTEYEWRRFQWNVMPQKTENNKTGNNKTGNNKTGNNKTGNNKTGNNKTGNNRTGNKKTGNNKEGNNKEGNNRAGNNKAGSNKTGSKKTGENIRMLPLTDDNIQRICGKFDMKYNIASNVIFLKTAVGHWRVYVRENKVDKVFHGNYRISKTDFFKKNKKCNEGFHRQDVSMENLYDVVKYIYYHDKNIFRNKRSRIDMLFDKIEQERVMKELSEKSQKLS